MLHDFDSLSVFTGNNMEDGGKCLESFLGNFRHSFLLLRLSNRLQYALMKCFDMRWGNEGIVHLAIPVDVHHIREVRALADVAYNLVGNVYLVGTVLGIVTAFCAVELRAWFLFSGAFRFVLTAR